MDSAQATTRSPAQPPGPAQLRALLAARRFEDAVAGALRLLAETPAQRDVLLILAFAQRFLGRITEALQSLATLERDHPHFSRLYEERGRCLVELRQAPAAIEAFLRAVNLNQALSGSWGMLEGLYRMQGDARNAAVAAQHVAILRGLPEAVVAATALFQDGDTEAAEPLVRAYLLKHGDHIEAMRLLARIGIAQKVFFDAQILLGAVLERAPEYRVARHEYAFVLVQLHRYEEAREQLAQLMRNEPDSPVLKTLYAASCIGVGEHEKALTLYRELLVGDARDAETHLSIGHAQKTLARTQEAVNSYRRAAECRAEFGDAYWSLANLKTYRFTDAEIARMRAALAAPAISVADRYHFCFALGKALEDRSDFAGAFHYYQLGNELKRPECRYRAEFIETNTREQIKVCSREFFASRAGWGDPSPDPILIIGLPRSGSTLIEQILASHSRIEGTQELPNVQQIVSRLLGFEPQGEDPCYPRILTTLSAQDFRTLGEEYLSRTRVYRSGLPHFIDKMPNNFRHLALIRLMLPNARIVDARREPMACCFSNFKQLFANGQEFSYSIEGIARYYRTYLELMRHWDRVLPGGILRVYHEDVVDDLEHSVRRLLDFCGLEFEPQCLAFHETERSVRTASSEQVRQRIYRDGLEQWKNFEPWLGPLREALGDALVRYREDATAH